ncbi:hypothetical protein LTR84_007710 [Exophiala bonariae]|uniref:Uncharacterized protein n=1 Tax=Exophiala bonariae TaxID=1690606 RepID=A0AAV9NLX0_9EURO|nr:hypothetical protein LTR84_007710 [Exophiala bonariae]
MEDTAGYGAPDPPNTEENGIVESRLGLWILANLEDGPSHAQRTFQSNIALAENLVISLLSDKSTHCEGFQVTDVLRRSLYFDFNHRAKTQNALLNLTDLDDSEDRIETYILWTYTQNVEITMLLVDELWPTALEGCLDMLIWLISLSHEPDRILCYALERRIWDLLDHSEGGLYEHNVKTLASFDRFIDLLYYQEMKNKYLSHLRYTAAKWVVLRSDEFFTRSSFMRELLQRFPGFKYTFAKVWVNTWRTRLPHGWVDTLHKVPIRVTAVDTDSDDPADFDGFNAWEQDENRQMLDPDYVQPNSEQPKPAPTHDLGHPNLRFFFFNGEGAPTEQKSVRFEAQGLHDLHVLAELATRRMESPENWSVSDGSSGLENGSSYELSPQNTALMPDEDLAPLQQYAVRSNLISELDDEINAEDGL